MYGGTRMSILVLPFPIARSTTRGIGTSLIHSSSLQQQLRYRSGEWVPNSQLRQHYDTGGEVLVGPQIDEVSAYL